MDEKVRGILDMHVALLPSYEALPDKSGIEKHLIEFDGFDGNNETDYCTAAEQMAESYPTLNACDSHMPRVQRYLGILDRWQSCRDRNNLTKEDILRIINRPAGE